MAKDNYIYLHTSPQICKIISEYIKENKINETNNIDIYSDQNEDKVILINNNYTKTYIPPIKIGELLDQINYYNNNKANLINFDNACLNLDDGVFTKENGDRIFLTEKETKILHSLYLKKGQIISKDQLLENIWEYSQNVETHTLETHIYRLRRKIENNPSKPQILITKENGYMVL